MQVFLPSLVGRTAMALIVCAPLALSPAQAFDSTGSDIADAFLAVLESGKGKVEGYGAVSESGDTVTIEAIQLTDKGSDAKEARIGSAELIGGEILANGRLQLEELAAIDITVDADDGGIAVALLTMTDVVLPSPEELGGTGKPVVGPSYGTMEAEDIEITAEDGVKVTIDGVAVAIDEMDGDLPTAGGFVVEGLLIEAANLDAKGKKAFADLGYERLTLSVEGEGRWNPEAATVDITNLAISSDDAGSLLVEFSLGGITRDLVAQLNAVQDKPETAMGLMQGVTVKTLTVRIDNGSIVERVLDMQAKEAGTDRATLVQQLSAGLPMMVSILQNPEFQATVVNAATMFLNDPVSLEITAKPAAPVPFAQIMGQAMMAPQTLPQVLGVNVSANSPQ